MREGFTGRFNRRYSLRRRLLAVSSAAFLALISLAAVGVWAYARTAANETFDLLLRGAAIAMLERVAMAPDGIEIDLPASAFEILALNERDRIFYRIVDGAGRTLTGQADLPGTWMDRRERPLQDAVFFDGTYSDEPVRFVVNGRLIPGAARPRWVGVQIGQTRQARNAMQADLMLKGIVPLAMLSLLAIAVAWVGIGLAMRPLAGIERDIAERQPLDLEPLKAEPPREIEGLIAAINGFMRRLGQSRRQAETFIADVAHQTRTSLAMLQTHLEAADHEGTVDPAHLRRAREQARRTVRMTNQLLSHALVIHRSDREMFSSVDLHEVILRLLEECVRDRADDVDGIEFAADLPDERRPALIEGDAIAIREALRNLVDNAIRHGPAVNEIVIGLKPTRKGTGEKTLHVPENVGAFGKDVPRTGGSGIARSVPCDGGVVAAYELWVEDRGPGVPDGEKLKVLERFYSNGAGGGSGIGLAIVAAVTESHGGQLMLRDAVPKGLRCVMRLPVSQRAETFA